MQTIPEEREDAPYCGIDSCCCIDSAGFDFSKKKLAGSEVCVAIPQIRLSTNNQRATREEGGDAPYCGIDCIGICCSGYICCCGGAVAPGGLISAGMHCSAHLQIRSSRLHSRLASQLSFSRLSAISASSQLSCPASELSTSGHDARDPRRLRTPEHWRTTGCAGPAG